MIENDSLVRISAMAKLMLRQQREVEDLEVKLRTAKASLKQTAQTDIPDLMKELELSEITLSTGQQITIKDDVQAAIPEGSMPKAMAWLKEQGCDGIVKTKIAIVYERGQADKAHEDAQKIAQELSVAVEISDTIHPQTLRAFVRERMEEGKPIPFDLFGVFPYSEAKIKQK